MVTAFGTAFLRGAVVRTHVLPRWMAWTLVMIGLVTIPILFATPLPIGPDWASDFLAFLVNALRSEQVWPANVKHCPQS